MDHKATYTILECPHCGDTKRILNLICALTDTTEYWSDSRSIMPYLPTIMPLQRCMKCGKYYFTKPEQHHVADIDADVDTLNYAELKEAKDQFDGQKLTQWQQEMLDKELFMAYNDEFRRNRNHNQPTDEDTALYHSCIDSLLLNGQTPLCNPLYQAELLRESGRFTNAAMLAAHIADDDSEMWSDWERLVAKAINRHAEDYDDAPFLLVKDHVPMTSDE